MKTCIVHISYTYECCMDVKHRMQNWDGTDTLFIHQYVKWTIPSVLTLLIHLSDGRDGMRRAGTLGNAIHYDTRPKI